MTDPLVIAGTTLNSRLFVGTAGYPNQQLLLDLADRIKAELAQLQKLVGRARLAQRVEVGDKMAQVAIGIDQPNDPGLVASLERLPRQPATA